MSDALGSLTVAQMQILMFNNLYSPRQLGGAEKSVQLLAEALVNAGVSVHVVTFTDECLTTRKALNGVQVHEWPIKNIYWPFGAERQNAVQRLRWQKNDIDNRGYDAFFELLLSELQPDIIHTHNLGGFSTRIWLLARRNRIPIVHTLRDYYLSCPRLTRFKKRANCDNTCWGCRLFFEVRRKDSRVVDAVVGISDFILKHHLELGFFRGADVSVTIPNSVEPVDQMRPRDSRTSSAIGYLGSLAHHKGVEALIDSFSRCAPNNCQLLLAGRGDERFIESLKARSQHPGIHYLGFVGRQELFRRCSTIVIPSVWNEPFGRVAVEAASYGLRIICSNRGGLGELAVQIGADLFDPSEPASLDQLLRNVVSGFSRKRNMRSESLNRFSLSNVAEAYLSVYRQLTAERLAFDPAQKH